MNLSRREALLTFAAAFVPQQAPPQQPAPPPDTEAAAGELRNVLNGLVRYEVVRRGAKLSDGAVREVESMIGAGVETMKKRNDLLNLYAVSSAIDAARRLGAEIVIEANRVRADLKQIGAGIVQTVRKNLCPLYPFC